MQTLFKNFRFSFLFLLFFIVSSYVNASVDSPISIEMNSTVNGELTTESETSPNSHNASEYYTFTLTEEKNIMISLESNIYYKFYLLDVNGSVIKEVSQYDNMKNKIVMTLAQGSYKIDVTTVFDNEFGSFNISLGENVIETNNISLETILDGEWTSSSGISPRSKNYTNYYTFTLNEKTDILIDLENDTASLYLLDSNNNVIDSAEPFINTHAKLLKTLEAGTYTIDATNNSYTDTTGIYTLRFKTNTIVTTEIDLNSTIEGTWSLSSGTSPRSKDYSNYYTFDVDERTDIIIELSGDVNYQKLYLLDSNNTVLTVLSDDNYNNTRLIATLEAGTYTIDATTNSYGSNSTGEYTLKINENVISTTGIELNTTISGEWSSTSGFSPRVNAYSNYYSFTLTETKDIVIFLESENNKHIYLLDANNSVLASGYGYNKTILNTTLEAGTYLIDVASSHSNEVGDYNLSFRENIVSNRYIEFNSTTSGEWNNASGISPRSKSYANYYTFTLDKATDILIDLKTNNNKYLYLLDSSGSVVDSEWGRIIKRLDAGVYTMDATLNGYIELGSYELILKENIISTTNILFNQTTDGIWTHESGISSESERYVIEYTFTLASEKEVNINLSSENNTEFYLKDENGNIFEYRYGFSDSNATLTRLLSKGTYIVGVTTSHGNQIGEYSILVSADIFVPDTVTQLTISNINSYESEIFWNNNSKDVVGYKIYINDKLVATVDSNDNNYEIDGLAPDTNYSYSVVAYNSAGESEAVSGEFRTKKDDYAWLVPVYHGILY